MEDLPIQFLSRHRSAETQCWMHSYVRTWYVRTSLFAMRPRKCCMLYTVSNEFIACKYIFESDYGFAWLLMNPLIKTAAT